MMLEAHLAGHLARRVGAARPPALWPHCRMCGAMESGQIACRMCGRSFAQRGNRRHVYCKE